MNIFGETKRATGSNSLESWILTRLFNFRTADCCYQVQVLTCYLRDRRKVIMQIR